MDALAPEVFTKRKKSMKLGDEEEAPVGTKNGLPSVFVGNLDPDVNVATVQTLLAAFGEVRSCSIGRKTNKAFAAVHLLSSAAVQEVVAKLNGTQFNGRTLHVEPYNKQKKKAGKNKEKALQEAKSLTSPQKEGKSQHTSPRKEAKGQTPSPKKEVPNNNNNNHSNSNNSNKTPHKEHKSGSPANEAGGPTFHFLEEPSVELYPVRVGNLPFPITRVQFRALFNPFGEVKKLKLKPGRGVVWFDHPAKAITAAATLKGTVFEGQLLTFDAPLLKATSLRSFMPVQHPQATSTANPGQCLLLALWTSSTQLARSQLMRTQKFQEVTRSMREITDAAIALQIPVITADLLSDFSEGVKSESVPPKISFFNITTFDITRDADVRRAIESKQKTTSVIIGAETDVSVLQTALGLLEMGHIVFVVADAVDTAAGESAATFALDRIRSAGGKITTKRSLICEWAGTVDKFEVICEWAGAVDKFEEAQWSAK